MKKKPFSKITVADVAKWMDMPVNQAMSFARQIDRHFHPTEERICKGKKREITPPRALGRKVLKKLHKGIRLHLSMHGSAHGAVESRSIITSARCHLGKKHVWTRDLKDCFPSITTEMLRAELIALGFKTQAARILSSLLTVRGVIVQGSPVSTDAVNLYLYRVDQLMASKADHHNLSYSRFVDDVVVSGNTKPAGDALIRRFEDEIQSRNMRINDKKRRKSGLQTRSAQQHVHNLRVDLKPGVRAGASHIDNARDTISRYLDGCRRATPDTLLSLAHLRRQLNGHINFLAQADASKVKHFRQELRLGDRLVKKRLSGARLSAHQGRWWTISKKRNEPSRLASVGRRRIAKEVGSSPS